LKNKPIRTAGLAAVAAVCLGFATTGFAQKLTDYSADQVTMSADRKPLSRSRISFSGGRMRIDDVMPQSGAKLSVIYRSDLKKTFMINTDQKAYTETQLDEKEMAGAIRSMASVTNRKEKSLGEDTVSGYRCSVKEIEAQIEVMGIKRTTHSTVCLSPKFDMPLRSRSDAGQITELQNIQEARPAAALFDVPPDFKRVANMMELMGDLRPAGRRPPK
jgi:hypothetical protein